MVSLVTVNIVPASLSSIISPYKVWFQGTPGLTFPHIIPGKYSKGWFKSLKSAREDGLYVGSLGFLSQSLVPGTVLTLGD